MRQQKEIQLSSYQKLKFQSQAIFSHSEQQAQKNNQNKAEIKTLKELEPSLRKSYYKHNRESKRILNKIGRCINSLWRELIPTIFKGNYSIQINQNSKQFYEVLRNSRKIIQEGSLFYCLDLCRRKNTPFIIAVYDNQQKLFGLPNYVQAKMKKYLILPINSSKAKELSFLGLIPSQTVTLHLCRFNFAGQIVRFCYTEGQVNEDQFELWISLGEIQIHDFGEFEQRTLNDIENDKQF